MRTLACIPLVLSFFAVVPVARGQSSGTQNNPNNALLGICSGVLAQGAGGVSGDHDKLCACLVRETSTKLTTAEMSAYSEASLNNAAPPSAVMDKVMAIATRCLSAAQ